MSFHNPGGQRRSTRNAGLPPPDPDHLSTTDDDGTTILYHEDDVTTMAPSLTPPILSNHSNHNTNDTTADVPSARSSDVSISQSTRDPPSSHHGDPPQRQHTHSRQNQNFGYQRSRQRQFTGPSGNPSHSGIESIPDSITTQGVSIVNPTRAIQQAQLDDLASRVITLDERIDQQNEFVQSSLQQIMKALKLPAINVHSGTSASKPPTSQQPPVVSTQAPPATQPTPQHPPSPPPYVPPTPPSHSDATHQASFDSSPARHPPPNVVTQTTMPFFFGQQPAPTNPLPSTTSTHPVPSQQPSNTTTTHYPYAIPANMPTTNPQPPINSTSNHPPVVPTTVFNPYGTSAPPVTAPPNTTPQQQPSTLQQMLTMMQQQQQQHQKVVKFEVYKEGKSMYPFWKAHSLAKLAASSDPFYNTMVIFNPATTVNTFNSNMSPSQNSQLYFITTAALGSTLSQQFISHHNAAASNGLKLWKDMDAQLLNREQGSAILKLNIRETYDNLTMNPSESILKFTNRYDEVYGKLMHNGMSHYTGIELTLHFIRSLKKPIIFADLLTKLTEPHNAKYLSSDLKELGRHLQTYHDEYITVHGDPSSAPTPAPTNMTPVGASPRTPGATPPTSAPSPAPAPTPAPTPAPIPAPSAPPTPSERTLHPAVAARLSTFKQKLVTSVDPTTLIVTTHRTCETPGTPPCLFHTLYREGNSHKFINCSLLTAVCQETGKTPNLVTAKYTIRNGPPPASTPIVTPVPPNPAPTPTPTPVPAPAPVQSTPTPAPTPPPVTSMPPAPSPYGHQQPHFQYQPQYPVQYPYPPYNYQQNGGFNNRYQRNSTPPRQYQPRNTLPPPPPAFHHQ